MPFRGVDLCKESPKTQAGGSFRALAQRAVSGMPSLSFSSGSSMPRATASSRLLSAMMGKGSSQLPLSSQLYARMSWLAYRCLSPNTFSLFRHQAGLQTHSAFIFRCSRVTLVQPRCSSTPSMERAIILTCRLLNSPPSLAARPNSVVQTGV